MLASAMHVDLEHPPPAFRDNATPPRDTPLFNAALKRDDASTRRYGVAAVLFALGLVGLAIYIIQYAMHRSGPTRTDEWLPASAALVLAAPLLFWGVRALRGRSRWSEHYRDLVRRADPALVWIYNHSPRRYSSGIVTFAFDDGRQLMLVMGGPTRASELITELTPDDAHFAVGVGFSYQYQHIYESRYRKGKG